MSSTHGSSVFFISCPNRDRFEPPLVSTASHFSLLGTVSLESMAVCWTRNHFAESHRFGNSTQTISIALSEAEVATLSTSSSWGTQAGVLAAPCHKEFIGHPLEKTQLSYTLIPDAAPAPLCRWPGWSLPGTHL